MNNNNFHLETVRMHGFKGNLPHGFGAPLHGPYHGYHPGYNPGFNPRPGGIALPFVGGLLTGALLSPIGAPMAQYPPYPYPHYPYPPAPYPVQNYPYYPSVYPTYPY